HPCQMSRRLQVGPRTNSHQHQAKSSRYTRTHGENQGLSQLSGAGGLQIGAEDLNKLIGIHSPFSSLIRNANAFRPRCTATFRADPHMPHRAAASLTLSPSSLTY